MATDLGRPIKNFTRWEFTLRDGLTYEDGSPVRAGDVVYAIKRQFADELPGGPTYGLVYFLGGETYDGPYADTNDFEAVETPDDKTIVVKMRKPFPLDASLRLASGVRSDSAGKGLSRGIHPASIGDRSVRIRP
jgi:peptide/nickel transport system substrate-binding protein